MLAYSIGTANFLEMSGMPDLLKTALLVIERPGVDGSAFVDLGYRGREFQLRTRVDAADYPSASQLFVTYCEMVGTAVDIVWMGQPLSQLNIQFEVMDVRPALVCMLAGGVGGLYPPSQGWCECDWTLKCIPVTS